MSGGGGSTGGPSLGGGGGGGGGGVPATAKPTSKPRVLPQIARMRGYQRLASEQGVPFAIAEGEATTISDWIGLDCMVPRTGSN